MSEKVTIEAEPGDAIISSATGRILLNKQGQLSLIYGKKEEEKSTIEKPTTPERPATEGSIKKGSEGICHSVIFCIYSNSITKVYTLAHKLKTTVPSVTVIQNKPGSNKTPGYIVFPGPGSLIEVKSKDSEEIEIEFPSTGGGHTYWVTITG
jgi:hypothetical protein